VAFRVDRWLGRHRNDGVEPELHLPPPRLVSRAATLKLFPGIRREGLTGGAMWYDYQMVEADRLTIAFAAAADASGARLANHAEATDALKDGKAVTGMRVRDRLTGQTIEVRARLTINAAGAHAAHIMRAFGVTHAVPLVRAMNLVTRRPASDIALAAPGASGRMLTLVPWRGHALIGTSQTAAPRGPADAMPDAAAIEAFVADANAAFPALKLTRDEVTLVHRGLVPARGEGQADLLAAPRIMDHATDGVRGALTVLGVKYTTARGVAAHVTDRAARALGRAVPHSRTDQQPLPGAAIADHEALALETARDAALEVGAPIVRHLTAVYGDRCAPIIRLMAERSDWRMPLEPGTPAVGAEVIYAIRHEMALTLGDVLIRRTGLGADGRPSEGIVQAAARLAAEELEWTPERGQQEIDAVDAFYRVPW
jgi:glycerol-3-phosphate dehydrogenase